MHFLLGAVLLSSWVQVRSDAFVVKSPIGVEQAANVLKELETFYQIVGGQMFQGVRTPDLPLEVLVLEREEIASLGSDYIGDTGDLNGFYQKGIDRDFIVLSADLTGSVSTQVVYHELTHYLASRAMLRPPTWLNEGLGEYFGSASISGNRLRVGRVLEDKVRLLTSGAMLPLEELFAVGPNSSYYNERDKANVFYSQAWALVHFLLHGPYAEPFHEYLGALRRREVGLIEFLPVSASRFERDFVGYLRQTVQAQSPKRMEGRVELIDPTPRTIERAEIDASLAEMLLSRGRTEEALPYLEAASHYEPIQTQIEYFRGVLAWVAGEEEARDHFVDSLIDEEFGSRAAFHLVQMRELGIPEVRTTLERAAVAGSREPLIYWALSEIYLAEMKQIEGLVEIAAARHIPPELPRVRLMVEGVLEAEPVYREYASETRQHIEYRLLTTDESGPRVRDVVMPYYPEDLRDDSVHGDVILDVQVSPEGDVIGVWLISSEPDVFGNLATGAVRDWTFDPVPSKVRVSIRFLP